MRIFDPRELPLVENGTIIEVDADGITEHVDIIGADFITTFYRIMMPFGFTAPFRAPVLRVRRPVLSYEPNKLELLLLKERERLTAAGLLTLH